MTDVAPVTPDVVPPDLTDPVVRAVAVAAGARALHLGASFCQDRARVLAARVVDDAVAAAVDFVKREGQRG